jgi:hypothetical protein
VGDIKSARVEYMLMLEQSEFNLVFRAVGKACGAPASFKKTEMEALRKLNVKLASARLAAARQAFEVAQGAFDKAEELTAMAFPDEDALEQV